MKRSKITQIIEETQEFLKASKFRLPDFAYWTVDNWKQKDLSLYQEIFDVSLGWDVTDMGGGDFEHKGLTLFTIRNGSLIHKDLYPKSYAEKTLICRRNQIVPFHFHWYKTEDIINRGNGTLLLQLYNSTPEEEIDKKSDIHYKIDGCSYTNKAGCIVAISPGNSITLPTGLYHSFWTEDTDMLFIAEVSMCNDDSNDNRFITSQPRFSKIEEDVPTKWILVNEYEKLLAIKKSF